MNSRVARSPSDLQQGEFPNENDGGGSPDDVIQQGNEQMECEDLTESTEVRASSARQSL